MNPESLAESLPDLALLLKRDGTILAHLGGRGVPWLIPATSASADGPPTLRSLWPRTLADQVIALTRRAIDDRCPISIELRDEERRCEVDITPQSPERVLCIVRKATSFEETTANLHEEHVRSSLDRRGFLKRFRNSLSIAAITERPIALAAIEVDGLLELSRVLDSKISDQLLRRALERLPLSSPSDPKWYLGQLSQSLLVVVLETISRNDLEACLKGISESLKKPITLGKSVFQLTPHVGVAILGKDASSPKTLLDNARSSAIEARRAGKNTIFFFSDTLQLRSLARLDLTRELRRAIDAGEVSLRYVPRHDLTNGEPRALVAYAQWFDPLRGEIRPLDFLRVAESTGLAVALSRALMDRLKHDAPSLLRRVAAGVRLSFGPLRPHVVSDVFLSDIDQLLASGSVSSDALELRISERSYTTRGAEVWTALATRGVQLVVDEVARHMSSIDLLARVPLWGIQLDRAWAVSLNSDPTARRVCRAIAGVAKSLGLVPIATGVDNELQRVHLLECGCEQGLGDLYALPEDSRLAEVL